MVKEVKENMADDFDVEALLEAPYKKSDSGKYKQNGSRDSKKKKHRSRSKSPRRDHDANRGGKRNRGRSPGRDIAQRSRSRGMEREPDRGSRRRSPPVHVRHSRIGERRHSPPRHRERKRRTPSPLPPPPPPPPRPHIPVRMPDPELSPEEKDLRTVFCMQLSQRIRARDLEEFFSAVGRVRDVRIITDNKTRRSKGIAYVEFGSVDSVPLALGLTGQKILGVPIIVQHTQAEKNRASSSVLSLQRGNIGPMKLYIGSLHYNITEDMLKGIFEPFGKIESIQLIMDPETKRSKGYGFIGFRDSEDAKKALEQLNGFELAGRPIKLGHVTDRTDGFPNPSFFDTDELDRSGIDLGATGRLQLMAKLAEGTGLEIPAAATSALNIPGIAGPGAGLNAPPIATQCFMLSNMFDPATETNPHWDLEIRDDVVEECNKHGGVLHVYLDRNSPTGNVYCKCTTVPSAVASVNALHGRYFAGKVITAAYVPLLTYHGLFPESAAAMTVLQTSTARL